MGIISKVKVSERLSEVEYPEIPGFFVTLRYLDREKLTKIRNACIVRKRNRSTRQFDEEIDNDKFTELYAEAAIKGWRGLKFKHLKHFMPVDISNENPEQEIKYSEEDALDLLQNSTTFDQFLTDCMGDISTFEEEKEEEEVKN